MGFAPRTPPSCLAWSSTIVPCSVAFAAAGLIASVCLWLRLRSIEKRIADEEVHTRAKHVSARMQAAAGAKAMLGEWSSHDGYVHTEDIIDAVRGRRDPHSQWAAQKSRWPPQRIKFLSARFADEHGRFDIAALEAMCWYLHEGSATACTDELIHAWEELDRMRHKMGLRESLVPGATSWASGNRLGPTLG